MVLNIIFQETVFMENLQLKQQVILKKNLVIKLAIGIIAKNNNMLINNINIILKIFVVTSIILYMINSVYIFSNYDIRPSYWGLLVIILLIISIWTVNKQTTGYLTFYILLLLFLNITPNVLDNKVMERLYYVLNMKFDINQLFSGNNNFMITLLSWYFKNLNLIVGLFLLLFELPYRLYKTRKLSNI